MPYIERITKAGQTIEIERYYSSRYGKPGIRHRKKEKPTKEQQLKVNSRQAERKLRLLMNENFVSGDYHIILDYIRKEGEAPRSPEEMRKDIDIFLREMRKRYRRKGIEFKYIHVMEVGEKGSRHHHLVINKIDPKIIQKCWYKAYSGHNRVKIFPLDDSGNYADLAAYLIKYTDKHRKLKDGALMGKRWNASKNLRHPESKVRIIGHNSFRLEPKPRKGYYIDKKYTDIGMYPEEYGGYSYMRYILVRINQYNSRQPGT